MKRRILSALIALVLCLGMLPGRAWAEPAQDMVVGAYTYSGADIAAMNSLIQQHNLDAQENDPSNWGSLVSWNYKSQAEARRITHLELNSKSLTGNLDVSGFTALEWLDCPGNQLESLTLTGLDNLKTLLCYQNQLTTLDVSGLPALKDLACYNNQLTTLTLRGASALTSVGCDDNQLTSLDASGLTNLTSLSCRRNGMETLTLSGAVNLTMLFCSDNQLHSLDLSGTTKLASLEMGNNAVTSYTDKNDHTLTIGAAERGYSIIEQIYPAGNITLRIYFNSSTAEYWADGWTLSDGRYIETPTMPALTQDITATPVIKYRFISKLIDAIPDQPYTGEAIHPTPAVSAGTGDEKVTFEVGTDVQYSYEGDVTNVGSTTATVKITALADGNLSPVRTFLRTFQIVKATPSLTAPTAAAFYGQRLADVGLSGGSAVNPNSQLTVDGAWSWANENTHVTAAGSFPAQFTPSDTSNYELPQETSAAVTVSPATPNITITAPEQQAAGHWVSISTNAANPYDPALADVPAPKLTYQIGQDSPQKITGNRFLIPGGTAVGATITITAATDVVAGKYTAASQTTTVTVSAKPTPKLTVNSITVAYTGNAISNTAISGTATVDGVSIPGTWSFQDSAPISVADSGIKTIVFTPDDPDTYATATAEVQVTITPAPLSGKPSFTGGGSGKTLGDVTHTLPSGWPEGTFAWTDGDGTTAIEQGKAYGYTFTPDGGNHQTVTGTVVLWPRPSSGGSGGGSYTPSPPPVTTGTSTEGGTSTTETTAVPSASTQGGTASATVDTAMGNEIVKQAVDNKSENVVIAPSVTGSVTKTEVSIPASTVGQLGSQTGASLTVSTPVAEVTIPNGGLGSLGSAGGTVTVTAGQTGNTVELTVTAGGKTVERVPGGVTLTVPVEHTTPGTVAVLVHPDGTREVVRKSVADGDSVTIPLDGSAKLELVDNSKPFADVPATGWQAEAAAFVSSHELFSGTAPGQFSPNAPMSRGMLAVVLHNLERNPAQTLTGVFADVDGGQWYAEGVAWAEAQGIIGGYGSGRFGPNDNVTREQLAVMLWRYAGNPAATVQGLSFADADEASGWAVDALRWAAEKGILSGRGDGILDPAGQATRAETARMLMNFLEKR